MKTIITSEGNTVDSLFDLRFGRAAWFCLFNEEDNRIEFYENEYSEAQGGAGTKAAEKMVEMGVEKIISGDFGPKAKEILERFRIQLVILPDNGKKVKDIIETLKQRKSVEP
jgi:predicted Fe-Mo cluster-binding NifX family protein